MGGGGGGREREIHEPTHGENLSKKVTLALTLTLTKYKLINRSTFTQQLYRQ